MKFGTLFSIPDRIAIDAPIHITLALLFFFKIKEATSSCFGVGSVIKIKSFFKYLYFSFAKFFPNCHILKGYYEYLYHIFSLKIFLIYDVNFPRLQIF